jgi:hypothetical protein
MPGQKSQREGGGRTKKESKSWQETSGLHGIGAASAITKSGAADAAEAGALVLLWCAATQMGQFLVDRAEWSP